MESHMKRPSKHKGVGGQALFEKPEHHPGVNPRSQHPLSLAIKPGRQFSCMDGRVGWRRDLFPLHHGHVRRGN